MVALSGVVLKESSSPLTDWCRNFWKEKNLLLSKRRKCVLGIPILIHVIKILDLHFQVERDTAYYRVTAAKQLYQALRENKSVHAEMRLVLKLPTPSEPKNHIIGRVWKTIQYILFTCVFLPKKKIKIGKYQGNSSVRPNEHHKNLKQFQLCYIPGALINRCVLILLL